MAESENRVLSEKLSALQQSHTEQEELVSRLQERVAILQNNLTDNEVRVSLFLFHLISVLFYCFYFIVFLNHISNFKSFLDVHVQFMICVSS